MNTLRVAGLHHRYGKAPTLHGIDLTVPGGALCCLIGPSGCGKTTLLRCIAGHERPTAGEITLGAIPLDDGRIHLPPERRRVGMVFQDYALFPHLTVWRNVAFGLHRLPRPERRARAQAELERLGVGDLADRYPDTCSGGQQQRIALARALAPRPRALLLDEPFSGLDTLLRSRLRAQLPAVLREAGVTVVMVTHDPADALALGDHIAVLRAGRIVQQGTAAELRSAPADQDVAAFIGG